MSADQIVRALLDSDSELSGIVETRIYSDTRPEKDPLPAVVLSVISDQPDSPINGGVGREPCTGRIQVSCFSRSAAEVRSVVAKVVGATHKQSGVILGFQVTAVLQESSGPSSYDEQVGIYMIPVDVIVNYVR